MGPRCCGDDDTMGSKSKEFCISILRSKKRKLEEWEE